MSYPRLTASLDIFLETQLLLVLDSVTPVIVTLNLLDNLLHLLNLSLPLFLSHFAFRPEELLVWLPVAAKYAIPQGEVLSIVVVEVQVVHSMACCSVDQWAVGSVLAVVDHDGPDVDEAE